MEIDNIIGIFQTYGIEVSLLKETSGSQVVRCKFKAKSKKDIEKFRKVKEDLSLALKSSFSDVRTYIPKTEALNIIVELPKAQKEYVYLTEELKECKKELENYKLPLVLGRDLESNLVIKDITETGSILISGATGSGKSVFLNSVINTILLTKTPQEVQLMLVDFKQAEFHIYENIPHLKYPVLFDVEQAVFTMSNLLYEREKKKGESYPDIVIFLEDYADFIAIEHYKDLTNQILKILTDGYKYGIYIILSSSKISNNELLKKIRESIPVKLTGALATSQDSITVLGEEGAEDLLGNGDMIFKNMNTNEKIRVQTPFISTDETELIVRSLSKENKSKDMEPEKTDDEIDLLYENAKKLVLDYKKASAPLLQRKLQISYNLAARLIEKLEENGVVGPQEGVKPRKVLIKGYVSNGQEITEEKEVLFEDAKKLIIEKRQASSRFLQEELGIGYNKAVKLIEQLEKYGVIGPIEIIEKREILLNKYEPPIESKITNSEDV